jgi:hypothetical protein
VKPRDIKVGRTYCNRGKGRTRRTVLEISDKILPSWFSGRSGSDNLVVTFEQEGIIGSLYLPIFAQWCGREVEAGQNSG